MNPLARRPGFVPMPPSPTPTRRRSTASNASNPVRPRSSLMVSVSGSPGYKSRPKSPMMASAASPMASRIPRKSPGTALTAPAPAPALTKKGPSTASQRVVVQSRRVRAIKSTGTRLPVAPKPKRSPQVNPNKPLPSPPVASVINPLSPPKAQRTLIDAEVAGTPSSEEWPVLEPEIISPPGDETTNNTNTTVNSSPLAQTVLLFEEERKLITGVSDCPATALPSTPREHAVEEVTSSSSPFEETPHMLIDVDADPDTSVHALTTPDNEGSDSPLAYKFAVPPRRSSLPVATTSDQSEMMKAAVTALSRRRGAKKSDTQWPLLDTADQDADSTASHSDQSEVQDVGDSDKNTNDVRDKDMSADTYHTAASQRASLDSVSVWSQATGLSVHEDEPVIQEPGYRTKRLSGHSSKSGEGMTLKIADDADAFLLGNDVPPIPKIVKGSKRQSLTSVAGRLSQQTASRLSLLSSRSNTPQSAAERRASDSSAIAERRTSRLPTRSGLRPSTSPQTSPPPEDNVTVRKRNSQVTPKPSIPVAARPQRSLPARSSPATMNRSKTSPALPRPTPPTSRTGQSPSYARPTASSSRDVGYLDQRATQRKPSKSLNQLAEQKLEGQKIGANKEDKALPKKENKSATEKIVKPKRSFRNIFHKRDNKEEVPPVPAIPAVPKRSSRLGSALGDRLRNSVTLSKNSQKAPEEEERHPTTSKGEMAKSRGNLQPITSQSPASIPTQTQTQSNAVRTMTPPGPASNAQSTTVSDTATVVNNLISQVALLPNSSPDRLRGLEIAEAVLSSVEACNQAKIAATEAQASARQAELNVEKAGLALNRMEKLLEGSFDVETARTLKHLLMSIKGKSSPLALRSTSNPQ